MAFLLQRCDRRDAADRIEFGEAAYAFWRALRGGDGIRNGLRHELQALID